MEQKSFGESGVLFLVFAIRDEKAQAFIAPFIFQQFGEAERFFQDILSDDRSSYRKHPADYTLYHIGSFDTGKGALAPVLPNRICSGADFVKSE